MGVHEAEGGASPSVPSSLAQVLTTHKEAGALLALALVVLVFALMNPAFLTLGTVGDVLTVAAELGVAALGVTLLMIAGEFDLSIGSNFAMTGMILAMLVSDAGLPGWLALPAALLVSLAIGAINGAVTLGTGIPSFIATLGGMMFWRGMALFASGGWPISVHESMLLTDLLGGFRLFGWVGVSAVWWLLLALLSWIVLGRSRFGNWIFATGGNPTASRALGVPTSRVKMATFMLAGLLAGLAGTLQFGRIGSMSPVWGTQLELEAIAAAVIGGTALSGGSGTVVGTVLGALTMASIRSGLVMIGAPSYWYEAFIGVVLVIAVVINVRVGRVRA